MRSSISTGQLAGAGISHRRQSHIVSALAVALALSASLSVLAPDSAEARRRASTTQIVREPAKDEPLTIVVSLNQQRLKVFDRHGLVAQSPISSGSRGRETPTGIFTILQKNREHYSNLYNSAPMPNMQRITWSGVAMHAGHLPGYPASHGCIRLPYGFSRTLFSMTQLGNRVIVHDDMLEPKQVTHPRLFSALPEGQHDVPHPVRRTEVIAARTKAAGLSTVSAMLGVTPAAAAEAAIEIAARPDANTTLGATLSGPPTRAMALARRQAEIDAKAGVITDREKLHGEAAAALADANGVLNSARQDLKAARNAVGDLKRDVRDRERDLSRAERELKYFIQRQQREQQRAEARAAKREQQHSADAESNLDTDALTRRSEARKAEADKDAADREAAARTESELEAKTLTALHDSDTAKTFLAAQDKIIESREQAVKAAEADLGDLKKALADTRAGLDQARAEYQRSIAAVQQFGKPATVFISRRTGMLKIRQGNAEVYATPVKMTAPEYPIGTHVFTAMSFAGSSETELKWQVLTLTEETPDLPRRSPRNRSSANETERPVSVAMTAANALDRIEITSEMRAHITELMKPGSSLIISDDSASPETGQHTDFIVQPRI